MGAPLTLTKDNFQTEVVESSVPVLVDFWATWCGPCRAVAPIMNELAVEYDGRLKIGKVDIDNEQQLAADFGIRSIPTMLLFKDGKMLEQIVGAVPKGAIVQKLKGALEPAVA